MEVTIVKGYREQKDTEGRIAIALTPSERKLYNLEESEHRLDFTQAQKFLDLIWEKEGRLLTQNWYALIAILGQFQKLKSLWAIPYLLGDGNTVKPGDTIHIPSIEEKNALTYGLPSKDRQYSSRQIVTGTDAEGNICYQICYHFKDQPFGPVFAPRKELAKGLYGYTRS